MRTPVAALTCCLLVAALVAAPAVSGMPSTHSPSASDSLTGGDALVASDGATAVAPAQSDEPTNVSSPETIEIRIQPDGDARFVLSTELPAETENQRDAFDRVASEFEAGEYGRLGFGTYESVVDDVAAETGREMEILDAEPHTSRSEGVGHLEYRFTWTNFAAVENSSVTVGDSFRTGDGRWLRGLSADQRLVVRAPDGYGITESPSGPEIDGNALIWTGPVRFGSNDLTVTFGESAGESAFPFSTVLLGVGGLFAVVLLLGVVWQLAGSRSGGRTIGDRIGGVIPLRDTDDANGDSGPRDSADEASTGSAGAGYASATQETTAATADAPPSAATDAPGPDPAGDAVDPELLSDEERVEHLLEENGGRMKQANIVTETGWSNAKVSQLLSKMDEDDRVDKLRIGRENLITLPDVDVTDQE